jgi:hypothetical protein
VKVLDGSDDTEPPEDGSDRSTQAVAIDIQIDFVQP